MADLTLDEIARLRKIAESATPGPWKWWTSCSWRRLKRDDHGITQTVAEPFVASDGHPDLTISDEDMAHTASFSPDTTLRLLDMAERTAKAEAERDATQVSLLEERCRAQETLRETLKRGALVCREAGERLDAAEAEAKRLRAVLRWVSYRLAPCETTRVIRAAAEVRWDDVPSEAKGE